MGAPGSRELTWVYQDRRSRSDVFPNPFQKKSFAENCATLGLIGDSVARVLLMDPNPAEPTAEIGLFKLFRLIKLKYSARSSSATDPSNGKSRNIAASQSK